MIDAAFDEEHSPAVQFLVHQHRHRSAVRAYFREEAGGLLSAHEFALTAIVQFIQRFAGRKWGADLDDDARQKIEQVSQLSSLFLQGIDPCEVAIAEGLYGQAASLIRQRMEILAAMDEVWQGRRNPRRKPNIASLHDEIRRHYGVLSELTHAAVPDYLREMHTVTKGELVGATLMPVFNRNIAIFLYRIELLLLFDFSHRQEAAIRAAYGDGFSEEEGKILRAAMHAAKVALRNLKMSEPIGN